MIAQTTDSIVGRRVRYTQYSGDPFLREDDNDGNVPPATGVEGTIYALTNHPGIGDSYLDEQERLDDRWIDVRMDDDTKQTFWREELDLLPERVIDDHTSAVRDAKEKMNMKYHLPTSLTDLDPATVMVTSDNPIGLPHYASLPGSVYSSHYPSYCRLSPWAILFSRHFDLLGVKIVGGHGGARPDVVLPVVDRLRRTATYPLEVSILLRQDDHGSESTEFRLYPEETDCFVFSAFCDALHMVGLETGIVYDIDRPVYFFRVPKGTTLR